MTTPDFSDLKPYIEIWGMETYEERLERRSDSTMEEILNFYYAIVPRIEEIIEILNQFPLKEIPEELLPLANTVLAAVEVDGVVNGWKTPVQGGAHDPRDWRRKKHYADYR